MRVPRTVGWGVALALMTAAISGVSVYLNGLFVKEFRDPLLLTGVRNSLVGLAFIATVLARPSAVHEIRTLTARWRLGLVVLAVIGGSVPFFLFFEGLAQVGSPGAAFIHKTLFAWVALLAVPLLGESLGWPQLAALAGLLAGSALLTPPAGIGAGSGEVMLLAATLLWSVEVIVARRLLPSVSVRLAATARMALGALLMLGFLALDGRLWGAASFSVRQWLIVLATGGLLFGYVATWYGALQRATATLVTSVLVLGAVVTGVLGAIQSGHIPAGPQTAGLVLILAGGLAIGWLGPRRRPRNEYLRA